jgi:protein involved in polysaccharide export with SLBB domain
LAILALGCLAGCKTVVQGDLAKAPDWVDPNGFFARIPSPTPDLRLIQPADMLEVTVQVPYFTTTMSESEKNGKNTTRVRVADNGTIRLPEIGPEPVRVAGLTECQAEEAVTRECVTRGVYLNPSVTLQRTDRLYNEFRVDGAGVDKPGTYKLPRCASSLGEALHLAVMNQDADWHNVAIQRRTGLIRVDLETAAVNAAPLPEVEEGDMVFVPKLQRKPVYISGLVAGKVVSVALKPNQETRLLDVLAEAGGTTNYFADRVSVRREAPGRAAPTMGVYSIKNAKSGGPDNIVLAPGDHVEVIDTLATGTWDTFKEVIKHLVWSPFPTVF